MPNVQYQDGVEAIMNIGQAAKKGRGRPRKEEAVDVKKLEESIPPGSMHISVNIGQAAKKGRGRPTKEEAVDVKKLEESIPPDPNKGSVMDKGTEICMDPGGNGAILNVGGEGGPGPPSEGRSEQLLPDSRDG